MPPRTKKSVPLSKDPPPAEAPIVYFLRVSKEAQVLKKEDVVPESFVKTEYSEILKEETTNQQFDETVIHDIVAKIHQQSEYPAGTACFWCCHTFSWKSIVSPTHYDMYTNQYTAEGHFCSPECALSSIYDDVRLTDAQCWLRQSLLLAMYNLNNVVRAPDKRVLRLFGGTLSIEQYRRYVKEGGVALHIATPPIRLYMPSINTQASTRDVKSYVTLSNDVADKASQQLRLKRTKPVHTNVATLDKCMGLNTPS
jgi:hypothetical protein